MVYKRIILFFIGSLCHLTSCKEAIHVDGFDIDSWKKDTKGCANTRLALLAEFEQKIKPKLKGLSEKEVYTLLGKADINELSKRNQKFYYYYIEKGNQCLDSTTTTMARRIQIRFDAINNVSEVVIVYN